jgi:prepilin peptidase CpaA
MLHSWGFWILLVCLLATALAYDIRTRRIPNWLVVAGLIAGVACSLFSLQGTAIGSSSFVFDGFGGLSTSLLGAVIGLILLLPLYFLRAMGAGDVKLMAAIGAFLGPLQITGAVLLTFIAGGVLSLLAAIGTRSLPRVLDNLRLMSMTVTSGRASGMSLSDIQTTGRLPYAIAIATGTGLQLWLANRGGWLFV